MTTANLNCTLWIILAIDFCCDFPGQKSLETFGLFTFLDGGFSPQAFLFNDEMILSLFLYPCTLFTKFPV